MLGSFLLTPYPNLLFAVSTEGLAAVKSLPAFSLNPTRACVTPASLGHTWGRATASLGNLFPSSDPPGRSYSAVGRPGVGPVVPCLPGVP